MSQRPKIKLELTIWDKMLEVIGWILVLALWILTLTNYSDLPETIPTHYNAEGIADGFGNKDSIFTLPLIGTLLFVGMTVLNKFPHAFNYPTQITADNAQRQYTNATRMMRVLKLSVILLFGGIALQTIRHAHGDTSGLGAWFLPLTLGLTLIPVIYFLVKSSA